MAAAKKGPVTIAADSLLTFTWAARITDENKRPPFAYSTPHRYPLAV